jgi:hypothetical protein
MTNDELNLSLRRLYRLMAVIAILGFLAYVSLQGTLAAFGFLLGALVSIGNFWLFSWLSRAIAPGEGTRKPWQPVAFMGRYLILFFFGYVIVGALGVSPLPVVFGLFVSSAALLGSAIADIIQNLITGGRTQ